MQFGNTAESMSLDASTADQTLAEEYEANRIAVLLDVKKQAAARLLDTFALTFHNVDELCIRFRKQFVKDGDFYTYLGLRVNGRWYLTGGNPRTPQNISLDELVLWMVSGDFPVNDMTII